MYPTLLISSSWSVLLCTALFPHSSNSLSLSTLPYVSDMSSSLSPTSQSVPFSLSTSSPRTLLMNLLLLSNHSFSLTFISRIVCSLLSSLLNNCIFLSSSAFFNLRIFSFHLLSAFRSSSSSSSIRLCKFLTDHFRTFSTTLSSYFRFSFSSSSLACLLFRFTSYPYLAFFSLIFFNILNLFISTALYFSRCLSRL